MAGDTQPSVRFSLRRWSQRKLAAAREVERPSAVDDAELAAARTLDPVKIAVPVAADAVAAPARAMSPARDPADASNASSLALRGVPAGPSAAATALPPVESLTIDSDFSPFMRPGVDESLKRGALKQLFRDPSFNVMDGLDVYIDDYSKPSPLDPGVARALIQGRHIFDPPKTRVNPQGYVEDIPEDELDVTQSGPEGANAAAGHDTSAAWPPPSEQGPAIPDRITGEDAGAGTAPVPSDADRKDR